MRRGRSEPTGRGPARRRVAGALGLAGMLLATAASAQDAAREEGERARREQRAAAHAAGSADAAGLLPPLEAGQSVAYEQVLAHPDDVRLNFLYAQTQLRNGELRGAAATLERILLVKPGLLRARLLYAVVLYRLDDAPEAEREFRALRRMELPLPLKREIEGYLAEIERRQERTRIGASMTVGSQFDSNRNAGPDSDSVLFADIRVPLTSGSRARHDFAFVGMLGLDVEHDLETQAGHQLFARVDAFAQEQGRLDELDLQAVTATGGVLLRTPWLDLRPAAHYGFVGLDLERFLEMAGGSLEARRFFSRDLELFARVGVEHRDYDRSDRNRSLFERTGVRLDGALGGSLELGPTRRVDLLLDVADQGAKRSYWSYLSTGVGADTTWLLGGGQFLSAGAHFAREVYDGRDPAVSAKRRRRDLRLRSRLTYGAPLRLLLGRVEGVGFAHDILATLSAEHFRAFSNLRNYEYQNWQVSLLFTKRWQL